MSLFDQLFFNVFNHYKVKYKSRANTLALLYVSILQISLILLLGSFFAGFFRQMHVETLTSNNGWTLFIVISFVIYFKNWMSYNGRTRMVKNAKMSHKKKLGYNIILLWLLPIANTVLAIILLNSFL